MKPPPMSVPGVPSAPSSSPTRELKHFRPFSSIPRSYPPPDNSAHVLNTGYSFFISSLAPALAVIFTNPFDTVRLQLQGELLKRLKNSNQPSPILYKNSLECIAKTYRVEGIRGLQKGLTPAIFREGSKNLFRLGMYDPILRILHPPEKYNTTAPAWKMMTSGAICGAMGALASNPFELVKTRLQSKAVGSLASIGHQHQYTGVRMALASIYKEAGILGWYRGSMMSVGRSIVGSSSNLSTYHLLKETLIKKYGWKDHIWSDMVSGLASGFASVICMNPIDVLRTRYYNQPYDPNTGKGQYYSSPWQSAVSLIKNEGWSAFYKGFFSHFLRIGPHFCLTFMFLGVLKRGVQSHLALKESQTLFKTFDSDHDGKLTPHDLYALLRHYQVTPPTDLLDQVTFPLQFQQFQQFTSNLKLVQLSQKETMVKKWFQVLDLNQDGFIDSEDLKYSIGKEASLKLNSVSMMKAADLDRDGRISFQDFSKFLEKLEINSLPYSNSNTQPSLSLEPTFLLGWWSNNAKSSS